MNPFLNKCPCIVSRPLVKLEQQRRRTRATTSQEAHRAETHNASVAPAHGYVHTLYRTTYIFLNTHFILEYSIVIGKFPYYSNQWWQINSVNFMPAISVYCLSLFIQMQCLYLCFFLFTFRSVISIWSLSINKNARKKVW